MYDFVKQGQICMPKNPKHYDNLCYTNENNCRHAMVHGKSGSGINNTCYGDLLISVVAFLQMGKVADLSEFDKDQVVMAI